MMLKTTMLKARTSALTAIAAALALSSTPLLAQQVPTTTSPTDPVTQTPPVTTPPATDAAPTTPDTSTTETTATESSTSTAPVKTTTAQTKTVTRATRTAAARPAPAPSRPVTTRTTVTQTATAPTTPATQAPAQNANSQSAVAPVVDMTAKPANPPAQASKPSNTTNEMLEIGGGALALIALGGIAYSIARRRRREEEWHGEWSDEPVADHEHVIDEEPVAMAAATPAAIEPRHDPVVHEEQPTIVGPSVFSWGHEPEAPQGERDSDDDRLPGESWVERAYRGPSANNPSVSLKNRLRRAAFFDKRERDVAAGIAEPVDPDAGLPEAMAGQDERELA